MLTHVFFAIFLRILRQRFLHIKLLGNLCKAYATLHKYRAHRYSMDKTALSGGDWLVEVGWTLPVQCPTQRPFPKSITDSVELCRLARDPGIYTGLTLNTSCRGEISSRGNN